jgi:NitT/TauT family transport system substrate-binding protein
MKKRQLPLMLVVFAMMLVLSGCKSPEDGVLRIAVLPILDTLPMYVAEAEGYFAEQGVTVEFVAAASAAERDQLLQAGQVDGIVADLVALALYNRDATQVVAVRYAMASTADFAQFRVLAAGQSGITSVDGLRGVPIGISEGTVIEYVTYRLLEAEGLPKDAIITLAVPKIPDRMALLGAGELGAATLPEPLASLAMQQGAVVIVDDTRTPEVSCSVFAFRKDVVDEQPKTVRGFLAAVEQASAVVNADKTRWSDLLTEKGLVPPPLMGAYVLPDYPAAAVPTAAQFADVVAWLQETGRLATPPSYKDSVDASFLPGQ